MLKCRKATIGVGSSIGGFKTDGNSLYKGSWTATKTPAVFMCTGSTGNLTLAGRTGEGWCFGAGENFGVTIDGDLYAKNATLSGGNIGTWKVDDYGLIDTNHSTYIYSNGTFCFDPSAGNLCSFLETEQNSGIYVFSIGSKSLFKIGSTILTENTFKELLKLI
jgi:hypothetical protein